MQNQRTEPPATHQSRAVFLPANRKNRNRKNRFNFLTTENHNHENHHENRNRKLPTAFYKKPNE